MNLMISKQSVEGETWFLLVAYRKIQEERDNLKEEILSKKKPELEDVKNSQSIHIPKNEKA